MNTPDTTKITFTTALRRLGLAEEFRTRALAGRTDKELRAWAESLPELRALAFFPAVFRDTRRALGCSASRGGRREQRGEKFYEVRH